MSVPLNAVHRTPEQLEAGAVALDEVAEALERRASTNLDAPDWQQGVEAGHAGVAAQLRAEAEALRGVARMKRGR